MLILKYKSHKINPSIIFIDEAELAKTQVVNLSHCPNEQRLT
ncbi:hypothetical protein [Sphingobacterium sp.]|nr:hypothetical protein [Sphingobacterium sp.]